MNSSVSVRMHVPVSFDIKHPDRLGDKFVADILANRSRFITAHNISLQKESSAHKVLRCQVKFSPNCAFSPSDLVHIKLLCRHSIMNPEKIIDCGRECVNLFDVQWLRLRTDNSEAVVIPSLLGDCGKPIPKVSVFGGFMIGHPGTCREKWAKLLQIEPLQKTMVFTQNPDEMALSMYCSSVKVQHIRDSHTALDPEVSVYLISSKLSQIQTIEVDRVVVLEGETFVPHAMVTRAKVVWICMSTRVKSVTLSKLRSLLVWMRVLFFGHPLYQERYWTKERLAFVKPLIEILDNQSWVLPSTQLHLQCHLITWDIKESEHYDRFSRLLREGSTSEHWKMLQMASHGMCWNIDTHALANESLETHAAYDQLSIVSKKDLSGAKECAICCESVLRHPVQISSCKHWFCFSCIWTWAKMSSALSSNHEASCPLCRQRFQVESLRKREEKRSVLGFESIADHGKPGVIHLSSKLRGCAKFVASLQTRCPADKILVIGRKTHLQCLQLLLPDLDIDQTKTSRKRKRCSNLLGTVCPMSLSSLWTWRANHIIVTSLDLKHTKFVQQLLGCQAPQDVQVHVLAMKCSLESDIMTKISKCPSTDHVSVWKKLTWPSRFTYFK